MKFLDVVFYVVAAAAFVAFVKFFALPWVAPLYGRYRAWVMAKALGKK